MNKYALKKKIHAYDFAILEFNLYLETNPHDTNALHKMHQIQTERKELVREYERKYGPYIVKATQVKGNRWCWVDNPWPWEYNKEEDNI